MTVSIILSIFIFVLTVIGLENQGKKNDAKSRRIKDAVNKVKIEKYEYLEKSFYQRFLQPKLKNLFQKILFFLPKSTKYDNKQLEKNLKYAGISMPVSEFVAIKMVIVVFSILTFGCIALTATKKPEIRLLIILVGFLLGYAGPILFLKSTTQKRKVAIQHQLPEIMDILMVSIEAGLGLDEAITQMAGKIKGPIVDEFQIVIREIQMGKPRKEAFERLSNCADIQELKTFVSAVIQAEQLGIPIKNVLSVQSSALRELRKQIAEEKGMKAPVKMIIPMVLFILPVLFIVLLAPVVIQLIKQFG